MITNPAQECVLPISIGVYEYTYAASFKCDLLQFPEAASCGANVEVGFSTTSEDVVETDGFVTACVELLDGVPLEVVTAVIISTDGSAIGKCHLYWDVMFTRM